MIEQFYPSVKEPFDYHAAAHLLRRVMIGPKNEEINHALEIGLDATLEQIFQTWEPDTQRISEIALSPDIQVQQPIDYDEYVKWFWNKARMNNDYFHWQYLNFVSSPMRVQERLWLCWHGHFAITKNMYAENSFDYNALIRKFAFGNFKEMIKGITMNCNMQEYLTLYENYVNGSESFINENYAREFMEIHTCGRVDRYGKENYTHEDIRAAARGFTGWFSGAQTRSGYISRGSRFIDERHDTGSKTYLGRTGNWNSFDIIDIMFEERAEVIAFRMCKKFCQWFVCDNPDNDIVESLARTFVQHNWEVKPVLRELLGSRYFFDKSNIGVLKKSHIEFVLGLIRQFNVTNVPDFRTDTNRIPDLQPRLTEWGQTIHYPPSVQGWTGGRDWVNSAVLPRRYNFAIEIVRGSIEHLIHPEHEKNIYRIDPMSIGREFSEIDSPPEFASAMTKLYLPVIPDDEYAETILNALYSGSYEWDTQNPMLRTGERIRACLEQIIRHPSYQLM